ncbi:Uma2 family endonuclease [Roseiflexus sp.]|uniref:Uma2 family endonuclease n=1 Tax=Roseiflexus sp. TaxID=2562120 RepID=UPI0035B5142F
MALQLIAQIDRHGKAWTVWAPVGVRMPGCDPVQPDIVVVRREDRHIIHDRRINGVSALIVEVLSSSNPETDKTIKRAAYARAGVPEYWIVRPASRAVYQLPVNIRHGHPEQREGSCATRSDSSLRLP